jgi:hypothetical protein
MNTYFLRLIDESKKGERESLESDIQSHEIMLNKPCGKSHFELTETYYGRDIGRKSYHISFGTRPAFSFYSETNDMEISLSYHIRQRSSVYLHQGENEINVKFKDMDKFIHPSLGFKSNLIKRYYVIFSSGHIF